MHVLEEHAPVDAELMAAGVDLPGDRVRVEQLEDRLLGERSEGVVADVPERRSGERYSRLGKVWLSTDEK